MTWPVVGIFAIAALASGGLVFTLRRFGAREGHDHATTELLKRFFDGKACAICKQPIPPVRRMGLKPGLLNPETHDARLWDEIPNVDLASALDIHLPVCAACGTAESFRQHFPDRVVDHDRSLQDAHSPE